MKNLVSIDLPLNRLICYVIVGQDNVLVKVTSKTLHVATFFAGFKIVPVACLSL